MTHKIAESLLRISGKSLRLHIKKTQPLIRIIKVQNYLIERTPSGTQETFICDAGNLELWGDDAGETFCWKFTSQQFEQPISDGKVHASSLDAIEAFRYYMGMDFE